MRLIPFGKPIYPNLDEDLLKSILISGNLVHGKYTEEFEEGFKKFTGSKFAVSTSSATAALHLSYFNLGLSEGDEIIVPSLTHVATVHAALLCGLTPKFVDCDSLGNIDVSKIPEKITAKTKAIAIVHFLGTACDMTELNKICSEYNLVLIEDVALGINCFSGEKHLGTFGQTGTFSFYPVKHLSTGEGGMVLTQDEKFYKELKYTRAFGVDKTFSERGTSGSYDVVRLGFNYRISEIEAFLGINQLSNLSYFSERRKNNFLNLKQQINQLLNNTLTLINDIDIQKITPYSFTFIPNQIQEFNRLKFLEYLKSKGVGYSVYYPHPVPRLDYYRKKFKIDPQDYSRASIVSDHSISLPIGPHVTDSDVSYMSECINNFDWSTFG